MSPKAFQPPTRRGGSAPDPFVESGPLLPGEYRPLAPVPAASVREGLRGATEGDLLRALVTYHQWVRLDPVTLRRYSRHGGAAALAVTEALDNG